MQKTPLGLKLEQLKTEPVCQLNGNKYFHINLSKCERGLRVDACEVQMHPPVYQKLLVA